MKAMRSLVYAGLGLCFLFTTASAADMRETGRSVLEKKNALIEEAQKEKALAQQEAARVRARIMSDQKTLADTVRKLKAETNALESENGKLSSRRDELSEKERELNTRLGEVDAVIKELVGHIRIHARDLDALLDQNLQTALNPESGSMLDQFAGDSAFPGMADIREMVDLYFEDIRRSGEVRVENSPMINRSGEEVNGDILVLGNFTAAYQWRKETGFLDYSPSDRRFFALSKLPPRNMQRRIKSYMEGKSQDVPVDVSRGGALQQLTHRVSFTEQVNKGGPIVWPILAILFLSVMIIGERIVFLSKKKLDTETFMQNINALSSEEKWDQCRNLCERHQQKPLCRIILSGLNVKDMAREDMENAIQETILREIPPMERFLSTLGMLAAIAPLLGLLGTVTGMINTFHVITYYGTGDPRMMSGGISEALVTTMLGLMVAIPIMFAHTLLSRRVENMISSMEEKAVSFINTVYKTRVLL